MLSDDVTRKVRALLERANHPGTPQAEAKAALAMAYRLMAKYDLVVSLLAQQPDASTNASDQIVRRRYETVGPYRVRRSSVISGEVMQKGNSQSTPIKISAAVNAGILPRIQFGFAFIPNLLK